MGQPLALTATLARADGPAVAVPSGASTDIGARLDALPFCRMRLAVLAVTTLALFADIAEVALGNALGAIFQAPPHVMTPTELSLFLAAIFAGGAAGAPAFGALGDRTGRRLALQLALAAVAAGSLGAALSATTPALIGFRFLSGLGIGACPPLIAAYLADVMPPRVRGRMVCFCAGLAFLGAPAIIFLMRAASPETLGVAGWRWALGCGGVLAVIAAALLHWLPESPRWLAAAGRLAEAESALRRFGGPAAERAAPAVIDDRPPAAPERQPGRGAHSPLPLLCGLYLLSPWATIGFPLMSGAVMVAKRFSIGDSVVAAGLIMVGPVIGNLLMASAIDRIPRRASLVLAAAVMACLGLLFAAASNFVSLVILGIAFAFASAIYASVLGVYAAEIVPTGSRASRTAFAWGIGRLTSIFVPLVFVASMHHLGVWAMFVLIALALIASIALVVVAGPPGRSSQSVG